MIKDIFQLHFQFTPEGRELALVEDEHDLAFCETVGVRLQFFTTSLTFHESFPTRLTNNMTNFAARDGNISRNPVTN